MNEIIGVVPAGGRATRIHGFFKELMPIGISDADSSKFVMSSEKIVQSILDAGATAVHFVLNDKHNVIFNYYQSQGLFHGHVNFNTEPESPDVFGMPVGIDCIRDQLIHYEFVLMGMPDTVIEPQNSFSILLDLLKDRGADLALGVFQTDRRNKGGYIVFDEVTKEVVSHVDKDRPGFPEDAANSWAIACWTKRFTEFMHAFIQGERKKQPQVVTVDQRREILFGDVIDEAIKDTTIRCVADYIDRKHGFYWDIGAPDKYFDLLRHYSVTNGTVDATIRPHEEARSKKKVFISHSSEQKGIADNLQFMLSASGFDVFLDKYNIKAGQQITNKIKKAIEECDFFVLLLSADSAKSLWVQTEITLADTRGMLDKETLIPVQIQKIPETVANSIPLIPRNQYNWLDGSNGLRCVIERLVELSNNQ